MPTNHFKLLAIALIFGTPAFQAHATPSQRQTLMIAPVPNRTARSEADWVNMIPMSGPASKNEFCDSPVFVKQVDSLDGGFVYQEVCRWVTSNFVVQVRLSDGRRRAVGAGNLVRVIRDGPYRGYLLLQKHLYHAAGGSYDPTFVVRPDGYSAMMIPGTDRNYDEVVVNTWLKRNKWRAW